MRRATGYIEKAEVRRDPFRHFTSDQVLGPGAADSLLQWLETGVPWRLHQEAFFEQYECNLLSVPAPGDCAALFEQEALDTLKGRMEVLLGTKLRNQIEVVAHKLLPAQGIGIHNDEPHDDLETHRLVLQLNRGRSDDSGGHLFLFNSKSPFDVHAVVRPTHNTGFGFAMSDRSYHAVSDVRCGIRYTVVFSFWQEPIRHGDASRDDVSIGRELQPAGEPDLDAAEEHDIEPMLRLLRSAAAHQTDHSGQNLLTHLSNTYRILRRWDCPEHLCIAGLFHSVYGTEAFEPATFALEQRHVVRERIGSEAEYTAHLYCTTTRRSLYENLEHEQPYCLLDFRDGATVPITESCLSDLMTVDLANSLEQLSRVPLTPAMMEDDRRIYEKAIPLLPGAAIVELNWVYQSRNIAPEELSLEARLARLDPDAQARMEKVLLEALAEERQ